ncbi:Hypothetical predicted protein [Mytilus galloprovincialis]|uniref:Uncharacterized protein n=1 Tax=Mytilus galloprovincialis TaxID=29158 RepID=A0A8B6GXS4_MYTGA|nr:Hypothetical predicted protein [Mytilus galloprovincialis]
MLMNVLILIITFVFAAEGLCNFPCRRQEVEKYIKINDPGKNAIIQFNCKHPTLAISQGTGKTRECFERNGPFIVQRSGFRRFRCLKEMAIDLSGQNVVLYKKPFRSYLHTPSLCEVCGAQDCWSLAMFAAQGVSRQTAMKGMYQLSVKVKYEIMPFY